MYRRKMGNYSQLSQLFNNFPQYKKIGRNQQQYIFVTDKAHIASHPVWVFSRFAGARARNFGLYNPAPADPSSPVPPTTGWKYWDENAFVEDPDMAVTQFSDEGCASNNQRGLGCNPSGNCRVWCCDVVAQGTEEVPSCNSVLKHGLIRWQK
jgi:hypothetical protein